MKRLRGWPRYIGASIPLSSPAFLSDALRGFLVQNQRKKTVSKCSRRVILDRFPQKLPNYLRVVKGFRAILWKLSFKPVVGNLPCQNALCLQVQQEPRVRLRVCFQQWGWREKRRARRQEREGFTGGFRLQGGSTLMVMPVDGLKR